MTAADYTDLRRKRWVEAGLTTFGTERKNTRHPELAGLSSRDYHTNYMRKQRANDRKAWAQPKEAQCQT